MIDPTMSIDDVASGLRQAAADYLDRVDALVAHRPEDWTAPDRWAELGVLLADLVRVSLELFAVSFPLELDDDENLAQRMSSERLLQFTDELEAAFGRHDRYAFAMLVDDDLQPVERSISNDLADIYAELLPIGRHQELSAAERVWRWRLGYLSFWGYHALGALTACHLRAVGVWDTEWRPAD
jgi:hypothetical protein